MYKLTQKCCQVFNCHTIGKGEKRSEEGRNFGRTTFVYTVLVISKRGRIVRAVSWSLDGAFTWRKLRKRSCKSAWETLAARRPQSPHLHERSTGGFAYLWLFIMYNWRESACHIVPREATGPEATLPSASLRIRLAALHFGPTSLVAANAVHLFHASSSVLSPSLSLFLSPSVFLFLFFSFSVRYTRIFVTWAADVTSRNNSVNCVTDLLLIAISQRIFAFNILSIK